MLKDFQSDLFAIQANSNDVELISNTLKKVASIDISESSDDRILIADLYYASLKAIQAMEDDEIIKRLKDDIICAFENINLIAKSGEDSATLIIINFLNDLYQRREDLASGIELSHENLVVLLKDLDSIKFIFKFCDQDGKRYFPINRLLSNIILDSNFINTRIEPYHVNMFQLSVEMFKATSEDPSVRFNELIKECNLKFVSYLDGACLRVDTMDMCNFRNNQVMIFYNVNMQKVLIRHEDKKYFTDLPDGVDVISEFNMNKRPIGYFVELDVKGTAIDYSDAIKESPKEFLRLLYEGKYRNVLIEKMILKTSDGKYEPLNPFCKNDKYIIKGKINGREGKVFSTDRFISGIEEGRLQLFSTDNKHTVLDQISVGLCLYLLENYSVDIDTLFSDLEYDDWLQNIIIKNWVNNNINVYDSLEFALEKYAIDLDYCSRKNNIKDLRFEKGRIRDVLPYMFSLGWVYNILNLPDQPSIYIGTLIEEEEGYYIDFSPRVNRSVAKNINENISNTTSNNVKLSEETDPDEFYQDEKRRYFVYDGSEWHSSITLQNLYKIIVTIELNNSKMISYDINKCIHQNSFDVLKNIMKLHQKELSDIEIHKIDFDSLIKFRLTNNLLLNEIDSKKWKDYFNLFSKQQIIKFEDIIHDSYFSHKEEGVLVVPKDQVQQDAVLRKVYENYIRVNATRDLDWWYSCIELSMKDGAYYLKESRVNKLRFLFDNIEHGTAAIRTIAANLGKENEWIQFEQERTGVEESILKSRIECSKRKCQKYRCGNDVIELKDVYTTNQPLIEVHSFFGTDEGDELIKKFLAYSGIENSDDYVTHRKKIIKKAELVKDECKNLGIKYDDKIYIVIREFNMPKKDLLPIGAVGKADNVATLLVKKLEVKAP